MSKLKFVLAVAAASVFATVSAQAASSNSLVVDPTLVVQVSGGCGPHGWRGPWGHCHFARYYAPAPYGYYGNGCPPGYWRGPWGHCRNTPYHGRTPGGGWR